MIPRLKELYRKEAIPSLMKQFGYKNAMQVPRLEKIVMNMGLGKAVADPKIIDVAVEDMSRIAGQKPVVTKARKAISNFKIRRGLPIGCSVTLRRDHMYEFVDRLFNIALPRVRDFRGVSSKSFDGQGNYTLGIREHIIFAEIDFDKVEKVFGLNITFVTNARRPEEAKGLLSVLGMPFRDNA